MKNRAFRYSGNKLFLVDRINKLIKEQLPDYEKYYEPFLGSGAIFYNLSSFDKSKQYYISDTDKNIIAMHNAFIENDYHDYQYCLDHVELSYGDIKEDKEAYYAFRKAYNAMPDYNTNKYKGLYLLMLANSCINSMLRFGPNGMNQSFGHRHYVLDETTFNNIKERVSAENVSLERMSYESMFNHRNLLKTVVFFDPPYQSREMTYNAGFSRKNFIYFLACLTNQKGSLYMYTDIENVDSDKLLTLGWNKEVIRTMRTTCPSKSSEQTGNEVLYYIRT